MQMRLEDPAPTRRGGAHRLFQTWQEHASASELIGLLSAVDRDSRSRPRAIALTERLVVALCAGVSPQVASEAARREVLPMLCSEQKIDPVKLARTACRTVDQVEAECREREIRARARELGGQWRHPGRELRSRFQAELDRTGAGGRWSDVLSAIGREDLERRISRLLEEDEFQVLVTGSEWGTAAEQEARDELFDRLARESIRARTHSRPRPARSSPSLSPAFA